MQNEKQPSGCRACGISARTTERCRRSDGFLRPIGVRPAAASTQANRRSSPPTLHRGGIRSSETSGEASSSSFFHLARESAGLHHLKWQLPKFGTGPVEDTVSAATRPTPIAEI